MSHRRVSKHKRLNREQRADEAGQSLGESIHLQRTMQKYHRLVNEHKRLDSAQVRQDHKIIKRKNGKQK